MSTMDKRPELCGFRTHLDLEELLSKLRQADTGFMWGRHEKDAYDYITGSLNENKKDFVEIRYEDSEGRSSYEVLLHIHSHYLLHNFYGDMKWVCFGPDRLPHPPCEGITQARERLEETFYTALEKAALNYTPIFRPRSLMRISTINEPSTPSIEELESYLDALNGMKERFERKISTWEQMELYVQRARRQELIVGHRQRNASIVDFIADTEKLIASKKAR